MFAWALAVVVGALAWTAWAGLRDRRITSLAGAIEAKREGTAEEIEASEKGSEGSVPDDADH